MKKLLLPLLFVVAGCSTTPSLVSMEWPTAPQDLLTACPDLKQTAPTEKLSDVLSTVTDNYATYYTCQSRVDGWIKWYKSEKKISNRID
jgi:hypothetical protein